MLRLARLFIAVIIGLGITLFFAFQTSLPSIHGAFAVTNDSPITGTLLSAAYGFCTTLVGVFIGAAYRRLIQLRDQGITTVKFSKVTKDVFGSIDFHIGLIGSPLVFGLIWQAISDISIAGLTVIALQNGFASHAVLERVVPFTPPDTAKKP